MMDDADPKRILVAGATQVGKTWLLAAIERAALQNSANGPRLTFSPSLPRVDPDAETGEFITQATGQFLSRAADFFLRGTPLKATEEAQRYDFRLGVQEELTSASEEFEFLDAPGELTSPTDPSAISQKRKELLTEARQGYALVFCFEALPELDPASRLLNLELNLSTLLSNLTTAGGRINYDRILFLLTKIDILTSVFHDRFFGAKQAPMSPLQLAQRLDPLEQMRGIVGSENIGKFLFPDSACELAVGICSAIGFDSSDGQPMVSPYTGVSRMPKGRTTEEHYRLWAPFGVREALLFLTKGYESPCVRMIGPGDADFRHQPRAAYVSYRSCA